MSVIKKVFTQTIWQLLGKFSATASSLILLSLISRKYGELDTGIYTLALTYLAFFYLASDLGLNGYFLDKYKQDSTQIGVLYNIRLNLAVVLIITSIVIVPFLPFANFNFFLAVAFGSLTILGSAVLNTYNLTIQSKLNYWKTSISTFSGSLATLGLGTFLIFFNSPIEFLLLAFTVGILVNDTALILLTKQNFYTYFKLLDISKFISIFKIVWPISATLLINTFYFRIDTFILSSVKGFEDVGKYNLAYAIFQNILVLPTFIMNGFYPLMIEALQQSKEILMYQVKKAILIISGLGLLIAFFCYLLAPLIIEIIAGNNFIGSAKSLQILAFSFPAFFLSALFIWLLMTLKMYKRMLGVYIFGFLVNIILNSVYIPLYSFIAASWVTVFSEYLILILQIIILFPLLKKR